MKKLILFLVLAIIGVTLTLGSAWNEGWTVGGAWVGVVYALVFSAFVALFEKKAFEMPWWQIGNHTAIIVVASILAAIGFTIS